MRVPKYRRHSSGIAFVEHDGRRQYFSGRFNSDESRNEYINFLRGIGAITPSPADKPSLTVAEMVIAFLNFAITEYGCERGSEYHKLRVVGQYLIAKEGDTLASEFGPKRLKQVRDSLIPDDAQDTINAKLGRMKRMFAWAVSEELIPASVYQAIGTVGGIRRGRGGARLTKKRRPVSEADVFATLPQLNPLVRAMVKFQWFVGARSSSICRAKADQFDCSDSIWLWRPRHKSEHLGIELVLPIGPRAQSLLLPYLERARKSGGYLFDPRTIRRNRRYGKRYTSQSYRQAVQRAIKRLNAAREEKKEPPMTKWSPHQIRHAKGKAVRAKHGLEGARAALGHTTLAMADHYSEKNLELARQIAREMG
jgi:integrase